MVLASYLWSNYNWAQISLQHNRGFLKLSSISPISLLFHIWKHCITAETPDKRPSGTAAAAETRDDFSQRKWTRDRKLVKFI